MDEVRTPRLRLLPCSAEVANAALHNRSALPALLGVEVPDQWPASDLLDFLPLYAETVAENPAELGWGIWLVIHRAERVLVGDVGFKGRPDADGKVEIGYSVLPEYRRQSIASEAALGLVDWAFGHGEVRAVVAECLVDNMASIRILEGLGMTRVEQRGDMLRWELPRADWSGAR
jgi:ribosomal-protein-alanine N-acetyltransferase